MSTPGPRPPACAQAEPHPLASALADHVAHGGPVRDERTLRAIVTSALARASRPPGPAAGEARRSSSPPADEALARGLGLPGEGPARAAAVRVVRGYFDGLVASRRADPSLRVDELADAFVAGVWRGLAATGRERRTRGRMTLG